MHTKTFSQLASITAICLLAATTLLGFSQPTYAASAFEQMKGAIGLADLPSAQNDTGEPAVEAVVANIITLFLSVLGMVFFALMLYGGYVWMKAQGREEEVSRGQKIIQSAIIGIAIVFLAYVITYYIITGLEGIGTTTGGQIGSTPPAPTD